MMPTVSNIKNNTLLDSKWLPLIFFLLALIIRLYVNLYVNPFDQNLKYDMLGYHLRSTELLQNPFSTSYYLAFHPSGTDVLLAIYKFFVGKDNLNAIGILYALLGSSSAILAFYIAKKVSSFKIIPLLVLILCTFNINQIFINSFILSQPLHEFFLVLSIWCLLKMWETSSIRFALVAGFALGITALIRPDSLVLIVLLITLLTIYKIKYNYPLNYKLIICTALPFILCITFGIIKARIHTGHYGFLSTNGQYNLVFGRCHCNTYSIEPTKEGEIAFANNSSIPLLFLYGKQLDNEKNSFEPSAKLLPAAGVKIIYQGDLRDVAHHLEVSKQCMQQTGVLKQIYYSLINVSFLWRFVLWPANEIPSVTIPVILNLWNTWFTFYFMIGSFLGLSFLFTMKREHLNLNLLAINYLNLIIVSALVFGELRLRIPYDFNIIILALEVYFTIGTKISSLRVFSFLSRTVRIECNVVKT